MPDAAGPAGDPPLNELISWVLLAAYAGGVAALAVSLWRTVRLLRDQRAPPPAIDPAGPWPSLDVLVPVKDEAAHIARCLESVLAQDYPGLRVTVVNDRSTDGTEQVVQALQDRCPELRRVDIHELPAGYYGKPHALHQVTGGLTGECLAFVDSDLHLRPHCLRTLIAHLRANRLDWVATMGGPELRRFWERLLMPLFGAVAFAWYDPRKISDPRWPDAIGSALMVCRRDAYAAIGGHGAVLRIYDEDSELIRLAKRAGQRVSFVLASELFTQRHYGTLARTVHGLTRTCIGGIKTLPRLLFTIFALNFVSVLPGPIVALLGGLTAAGVTVPLAAGWLALAGLHAGLGLALAGLIYREAGVSARYAVLHPLGALVLMYICGRAIRQIRRGGAITWRGTTYAEPRPNAA